jgi:translocation and assembly module TamB
VRRWPIWRCARSCSRWSPARRARPARPNRRPPAIRTTSQAPAKPAAGFAVAGHLSIVNAKPGAIDQKLLPLIDANADVRLDAHTQSISNLNVRLVRSATLTGGGTLSGRHGQLDLNVARLDLNALQATVRPTQLSGPIAIRLNDDIQSLTLDLADPAAALRASASTTYASRRAAAASIYRAR